ncbi:gliding motility-associated C-terminal domain-containing protein [Formosa sp. Hel1_31_208]|nr:gliding motility-associated C-terminal domain-containing protein [Formosa sp. Hel1_31_208]
MVCVVFGLATVFKTNSHAFVFSTFKGISVITTDALVPNGTISGSTTVCLNDTPAPQITFTGSGGEVPYTFTYTLNGGTSQTVTTTGTNTSVSLNVNTNTAGTFVYQLQSVSDNTGDVTTENGTATVNVEDPPNVDFSFNNNNTCSGTPIVITPNITGNGPFDYSWSFGDGNTSTNMNPTHIYNAEGCGFSNFTITLTVTDNNGCTASSSQPISVEQRPELNFIDLDASFTAPFDNCGNNTADPEYTVNVGNDSPSASCVTSYDVDWGDGTSATNVTFPLSHTYLELGSFNMMVTAYGNSGCNTTETILIKNSSNPVGAIEIPGNTVNLCLPVLPIDFAIGSWGTNPPDTNYLIDYGDGTQVGFTQAQLEGSAFYNASDPGASQNYPIPHTYTESNCPNPNYTVSLIISTSCGESLLTAGPIIILSQPSVDFDVDPIACVNIPVLFENLTTGGFNQNCNTNTVYFWDFGDGGTSTLENPTHTYTTPGNYTVTLFAENFCGTTDVVTKTICIEPELVASFTTNPSFGCTPLAITTTNTTDVSQSCGGETYLWEVTYAADFCGTSELWSFTNGTNENSINPSLLFESAGLYSLTLTATNSCGSTTASQVIEVKQPPTASIDAIADSCGTAAINPVATVNNCAPASETISYTWSFPGGTPATSNQLNPGTINYTAVGMYTITFSVTNSCGTETVTQTFSVNETPTITNTVTNQSLCSGSESVAINLTAIPSAATYSWTSNAPAGLTGYIAAGTSNTIPAQTLINTTANPITLTYTVIPEIGGCFGLPVDFDIIVEPAPAITTQPQSDAVCLNGSTPDLSVVFQGSGSPIYQWYENTVDNTTTGTPIAGETGATFSPPTNTIGETYYYVIITFSTGGCNEITSQTAFIQVEEIAQIDSEPLNTQSICEGGTASELSLVVSGGAGTATYQWFSNTTNSNTGGTLIAGATGTNYIPPPFNTVGTYYFYVEVSYNASGCSGLISAVSEVVVVDDPDITTQPIASQSLCQNVTPQDLQVVITGGLGLTSYQWYVNTVNSNTGGTLIAGATTSLYTPPVTTVGTLYYYCIITQDVSGCEVVSTVSAVEVNAAAQFTSQPISDELCLGETTNTLVVAYTNGTGAPSYQWYENTINDTTSGTAIPGATTDSFNPPVDATGITYYYCIITLNAGGCSEIVSEVAEITVNETPSISDANLLICSGNSFTYIPDSSGGDTVPANTVYTWTPPLINPAGSITGASQQVTPSATIGQFLENITTTPATVTYTVTPTAGDCIGLDFEVVVTVNPSISVTSVVTNNTCFQSNNASIEISIVGGVPFTTGTPYVISWTGPNGFTSTDEDIFNLEQGTYTLSVDDDGGCPYTETFIVTEPDELVFSVVDFDPETISCFNANDGVINITVAGGTVAYSYSWTKDGVPFSTDEDLTNLGPGMYTITVSDANSCGPISLSFDIVEPPLLEVTLNTKTDILCFGDSTGAVAINVTGGRPNYTFSWTGPNAFTSVNQDIDTLLAGLYTVTVTDDSGCVDALDVNVLQNDEITIDVSTTEIECYGDNDASITINSISGGVSPYDIAWSNFGTGNSQTNLSAGTYTITITDAENCSRVFPIVIEEAPLFLIDPVVTQMSCSGENDASIILNFVGGIDPVTVVWNDDPTAGTERNNLAPGTYAVTITDGTPCVIQDSFTIFNILPLLASANITDALDCDDTNSGFINLLIEGGTPPFDVVWSNGATTEDLENIPPNTYTVQITDANGCELEGSWVVNRFEPLTVSVDIQSDVDCEAQTVNQTFVALASGGVPPFNFSWSSGTVSGLNNELMTTTQNGLVLLEVTDSQGCNTSFSLNVEIPVLGDPGFGVSSFGLVNYGVFAIQDPIEFTNTATGDYISILWDFGDGSFSSEENPIHTYVQVGNYVVTQTVTYPFGCVYSNIVTLIVEKGYKLMMPDAFTPNEDGLNDFYGPEHIGLNKLELNIYDTWGSLIYSESGDDIRGWDGKINDEDAENGNYYYTFSASTFYENVIEKRGAFVFIK